MDERDTLALSAIASRQAVVPLIWRDEVNEDEVWATVALGLGCRYETFPKASDVTRIGIQCARLVPTEDGDNELTILGYGKTLDEAKALAQADYTQRINSALAAPVRDETSQAARDVLAERERQVTAEGWTPEHDDSHANGQMAGAAACYAVTGIEHWARDEAIKRLWPWSVDWWKPTDRRRDLVKAGALILAEIERLDRRALAQQAKPQQEKI